MLNTITRGALCVLLFLLSVSFAFGSSIQLLSGVSPDEFNSITGSNVVITPHPVWYQDPQAKWISFENTGFGGIVIPNAPNFDAPSAIFYQDFEIDNVDTILGTLNVFADDTTAVLLDGLLLYAANPFQGPACADGPIGCVKGNGALINFNAPAGHHELEFDVFQRDGSTFGLLYNGLVTGDVRVTPEISSDILGLSGGLALIGLALLRRHLDRKSGLK